MEYRVYRLELGPLPTNTYIVAAQGEECAVVDPACDYGSICSFVSLMGLKTASVLLTHGHFDHIGAAGSFADAGIPVYLHPDDAEMPGDPMKNGSAPFGAPALSVQFQTVPVKDGDEIHVGDMTFSVMHTPGHTKGSVCYLFDGGMFTGDTVFEGGYGRTDLWGGSFDDLKKSLRRLFPVIKEKKIYPGH